MHLKFITVYYLRNLTFEQKGDLIKIMAMRLWIQRSVFGVRKYKGSVGWPYPILSTVQ